MKYFIIVFLLLTLQGFSQTFSDTNRIKSYIRSFKENDDETKINTIPNAKAWSWLKDNIPYFECPDKDFEQTYYFRWWTYRKHIKKTPEGYVITEFLPNVPWAGQYNTISCPAGHHFYEGRWLRDPKYLKDYASFWFAFGAQPRLYSFWAADAIMSFYKVHPEKKMIDALLPDLVKNYNRWEATNLDSTGLYWQIDDRDGMEKSIGGSGHRTTINSYQYGDALAIASMAQLTGKTEVADLFTSKAGTIKNNVQQMLWDEKAQFFKVQRFGKSQLEEVRELHGYVPWYFNMPDKKYEVSWKFLIDTAGFYAPYGPTSTERNHPRFLYKDTHECLWNGYSWPFATSQTLVALANVLNNSNQAYVTRKDYFELLKIYTKSHRLQKPDGKSVAWIDENLDPFTGEWQSRKVMYAQNKRWDKDRGKDYNHSTYNDLIISGLIGLHTQTDNTIEINPLLPENTWEYFCLENIPYHGYLLSVVYDKTGKKYKKGKGFFLYANGQLVSKSQELSKIIASFK